jgi:hypothetical protein
MSYKKHRWLARPAVWALLAVPIWPSQQACAARHVFSPYVEEGEFELETFFNQAVAGKSGVNGQGSYAGSIGYGVTSWWKTEIESTWSRSPGGSTALGTVLHDSVASENIFQLTERGEYWLDVGFFAEAEFVRQAGDHNNLTVGPLLAKEFGPSLTTLNLLFTQEFGSAAAGGQSVDFRLQSVWRVAPLFAPGVEAYWQPGNLGRFASYNSQGLIAGPVVTGGYRLGRAIKLKYEIGYLFGATNASPNGTVRGLLELEWRF